MKVSMIVFSGFLLWGAAACQTAQPPADRTALDAWSAGVVQQSGVNRAILIQHTLFPFHFEPNAATLNELGEHDLNVLAAAYKDHPGQVNMPRGDAASDLYTQRVAAVAASLTKAGVDKQRIQITAGLPGGEGMASERVLQILQTETTSVEPSAPETGRSKPTQQTGGPS